MNKHLKQIVAATILLGWLCCFDSQVVAQSPDQVKPPYAPSKPLNEPTIFASGIVSTGDFDSHPAFMPDGKTLYFVRSNPNFTFWTILVSQFQKGRWSEPTVAPFSGQYSDADPFITPDGKQFYFISSRPVAGKKEQDLDIYVMERTAKGDWSEPKNLGAPVNGDGAEWYPTIAANGTIYFGSDRAGGKGRTDLYRCKLVNGKYTEAESLGDVINTSFNEFEPYIAPDESFLIFMGGGREGSRGGLDLYITYHRAGAWTKPVNLGDKINSAGNEYSPMISPDGKYFFWASARSSADKPLEKRLNYRELMNKLHSPQNGLGDIYQIDLSELKIERW
ncbi:MAG: TolB family protein [Pyrinomonadaceae bacterium]